MIFFKLSWLPWILAIGGFIGLIGGEAFSIVPMIIGIIWLVSIFKGKSSSSTSTTSYTPKTPDVKPPIKETTPDTANTVVCPNCRETVGAGMSFCMKCGTKVR
jgi:hypothetical protein